MGIDTDFNKAYAKAAIASGQRLPSSGNVFISMIDKYKDAIVPIAADLQSLGFGIIATRGSAKHLRENGVKVGPRCWSQHVLGLQQCCISLLFSWSQVLNWRALFALPG